MSTNPPSKKILFASYFQEPTFESETRRQARERLGQILPLEPYSQDKFTAEDAPGVVAVLANSVCFSPEFYAAAEDLRAISRWGVGFDKVNVEEILSNQLITSNKQ